MKDSTSGVVRTPPKSQTIALILASAIVAHDLVVAEPLASLERPAEEGDLRPQPGVAAPSSELISVPAPRSGWPSSPSTQSSSVARRCTPSGPYSVESSVSATSAGAPSGPQSTAATVSSP